MKFSHSIDDFIEKNVPSKKSKRNALNKISKSNFMNVNNSHNQSLNQSLNQSNNLSKREINANNFISN